VDGGAERRRQELRNDVRVPQRLLRVDLHEVVRVAAALVGIGVVAARIALAGLDRLRGADVLVVHVARLAGELTDRIRAHGLPVPDVARGAVGRVVQTVLVTRGAQRAGAEVARRGTAAVADLGDVHRQLVFVVAVLVRVLERGLEHLPALLGLEQRVALVADVRIRPLELEVDVRAVVHGLDGDVRDVDHSAGLLLKKRRWRSPSTSFRRSEREMRSLRAVPDLKR